MQSDRFGEIDARSGPARPQVSWARSLAEFSAAAAAGGFAWFGGDLLHWERWGRRVEGAEMIGIMALMGLSGLVLGAIARRPGWMIGLATAALPIGRIPFDVIADPTSHNLLPFEVAIYLFVSSPAIVVAVLWDLVRGRGPFGTSSRGGPGAG